MLPDRVTVRQTERGQRVFMVTILPALSALHRKFRPNDFERRAYSVESVAPETTRSRPAALCLPNEIDRLIGAPEGTSFAIEAERLGSGVDRHGATSLHHYRNVSIIDGIVYAGLNASVLTAEKRRLVVSGLERISSGMLCSNYVIHRYFGHFAQEGLAMEMLAQSMGRLPITLARPAWMHDDGYRKALDLRNHAVRAARVDELTIVDDRGWNDHRLARFGKMREILRQAGSGSSASGSNAVFLSRGETGVGRRLYDSPAVEAALAHAGFDIVCPERLSFEQLAGRLHRAEIIVAVEGSALAHAALLSPAGATMIAIMPPRRLVTMFKPIATAAGMQWGYVAAEDRQDDQIEVDMARLFATIDLI